LFLENKTICHLRVFGTFVKHNSHRIVPKRGSRTYAYSHQNLLPSPTLEAPCLVYTLWHDTDMHCCKNH
jgi:hypothetical protein